MKRFDLNQPATIKREERASMTADDWRFVIRVVIGAALFVFVTAWLGLGLIDHLTKHARSTIEFKVQAAGLVGGLAGLGTGFWLLTRFYPDLFYNIETQTGLDINRDGVIGQPVRLETWLDPHQLRILNLPCTPDVLLEFMRAALENRSLGVRTWKDRIVYPGTTKSSYNEVRDRLITAGYMTLDGTQGLNLTSIGRAFAEQQTQTPLLAPPGGGRVETHGYTQEHSRAGGSEGEK